MSTEQAVQRTAVQGAAMLRDAGAVTWVAADPVWPGEPYVLNDVVAVGHTDAWAVGQRRSVPLIQRWDGGGWTVVADPRPAPAITAAGLRGVDAAGTGAAIAAIAVGGGYDRLAGAEVPLIYQWDGRRWERGHAPDLGGAYVLTDVTMMSALEAWAVGHGFPRRGGVRGAVVVHWDGSDWSRVPTPGLASSALMAIGDGSPDDIWAVGEHRDSRGRRPLLVHFNGADWREVPGPGMEARRALTDVAALSSGDAWAVGPGVVARWDGTAWTAVDAAGVTSANTVAASSPSDVWAAGQGDVAHFDGARWSRVAVRPDAVWTGSASVPGPEVAGEAAMFGGLWLVGFQRLRSPRG